MRTLTARANPLTSGAVSTVPALLLERLGERLAQQALQIQAGADDPARVRKAGGELERLGLEMQALVHALRGGVPARSERIDLRSAAAQALQQGRAALGQVGLKLELEAGPALEQDCEPELLQHGLDLLLAHALAGAHDACLAVVSADGGGACLRLTGVGDPGGAGDLELNWLLLRVLATACGWTLQRRPSRETGLVDVELWLGQPVDDAPGPVGDAGLPRRHVDRHAHVLVLDPHEPSRVQCAQLLSQAGMSYDCLATLDQAEALLRGSDPGWNALVSGIPEQQPRLAALVDTLRQRYGLVQWIELVDEDYRFDVGTPDFSHPARLGRSDLESTLLPALSN